MKEKNKNKKDIKRLAAKDGTLLLAILIGFAGGWLIGGLIEKTGTLLFSCRQRRMRQAISYADC